MVVVSGRPYALGECTAGAAGLVQAFMPGEEGGAALAGVLSGRVQPAASCRYRSPGTPVAQPRTYLQPPLGGRALRGISTVDPTPLFPFGYGLSYTSFDVDDLRISADRDTDRRRAHGHRPADATPAHGTGDEVVQLYLHDVVAQVTRPVKQLTGFARVSLEPGDGRRDASTSTPTGLPSPDVT